MPDEDNDKNEKGEEEKGEEEKGEEEKEPRRYDASDRDTDDQVGIDTILAPDDADDDEDALKVLPIPETPPAYTSDMPYDKD